MADLEEDTSPAGRLSGFPSDASDDDDARLLADEARALSDARARAADARARSDARASAASDDDARASAVYARAHDGAHARAVDARARSDARARRAAALPPPLRTAARSEAGGGGSPSPSAASATTTSTRATRPRVATSDALYARFVRDTTLQDPSPSAASMMGAVLTNARRRTAPYDAPAEPAEGWPAAPALPTAEEARGMVKHGRVFIVQRPFGASTTTPGRDAASVLFNGSHDARDPIFLTVDPLTGEELEDSTPFPLGWRTCCAAVLSADFSRPRQDVVTLSSCDDLRSAEDGNAYAGEEHFVYPKMLSALMKGRVIPFRPQLGEAVVLGRKHRAGKGGGGDDAAGSWVNPSIAYVTATPPPEEEGAMYAAYRVFIPNGVDGCGARGKAVEKPVRLRSLAPLFIPAAAIVLVPAAAGGGFIRAITQESFRGTRQLQATRRRLASITVGPIYGAPPADTVAVHLDNVLLLPRSLPLQFLAPLKDGVTTIAARDAWRWSFAAAYNAYGRLPAPARERLMDYRDADAQRALPRALRSSTCPSAADFAEEERSGRVAAAAAAAAEDDEAWGGGAWDWRSTASPPLSETAAVALAVERSLAEEAQREAAHRARKPAAAALAMGLDETRAALQVARSAAAERARVQEERAAAADARALASDKRAAAALALTAEQREEMRRISARLATTERHLTDALTVAAAASATRPPATSGAAPAASPDATRRSLFSTLPPSRSQARAAANGGGGARAEGVAAPLSFASAAAQPQPRQPLVLEAAAAAGPDHYAGAAPIPH